MSDEFLYNGETEVLIQTFAEETSKIPLIAEGKTFYASLAWDFIYRYGLKSEFLANFLGVSEEALLGAIGDLIKSIKIEIYGTPETPTRESIVQEARQRVKELESKISDIEEDLLDSYADANKILESD